ncbi:hypothetical protein [Actinopolyspora halophila]|uniref:hypothetical protein n=1 Tax=Actinopolyspora halophila TaxID=1850 RepID=UPI000361FA57|nr:hypothetical protein [Actinopolyspora halophila]
MPDDTITPQGIDPVSLVVLTSALLGLASMLGAVAVTVYVALAAALLLVIPGGVRSQRRALRELHTH